VHKIIPLVVFVSVSLIIGNQVAFAETNVWGFYGEEFGSATDATTNPGPDSSMTDIAFPGTFDQILAGVQEYQNVANAASAARSGPLLVASCFEGIPNPKDTDDDEDDDWVFGGVDGALPFQCVQNQRNEHDLGLGVRFEVPEGALPLVQPLEVEVGQLVVIDLRAILPTNPTNPHENFMFRISSNSAGEESFVAVSDKPPTDTLFFPGDFTPLGTEGGFFPGCSAGCANNDSDISFEPKNYLYYTQTTRDRDNLLQQIQADVKFIPPPVIPPPDLVGGHGGITDNTALLVSGSHLTASWMIPLLVSAIGIGVFVFTRK